MFTESQSKIFNEVLDLNWEASKAPTTAQKTYLQGEVNKKLELLKEDMGEEAYDKFMSNGKKMFAPRTES